MKKAFLSFLVIIAALTSAVIGIRYFISDETSTTEEHIHSYAEIVTVEATCEKDGEIKEVCECGDVNGDARVVPALGHDYVNNKCSRCTKKRTAFEIEKVEFIINGSAVDEYTAELYSEDVKISLRINDGADLTDNIPPIIKWSFIGDSYGSTVSEDGELSLGNFIGSVTLKATVQSSNVFSVSLPISVTPGSISFDSITVTSNDGYSQSYVEGDLFDRNSISVWGEKGDDAVRIYDFTVEQKTLTPDDTDIMVFYEDLFVDIPIVVKNKSLQYIEIISPASRLEYLEGQTFIKNGLEIKAHFENSAELVENFEVDEVTALAIGTDKVVVSYTHNGITKTAEQNITVIPKKLISISADTSKVRTIYTQGDIFNPAGLVVRASYESFGDVEISDYEYTQDVLIAGDTHVTISYTVGDVTKSINIDIDVVKPYAELSQIKVLSAADISILWSYSYMTDSGVRIIDNTAYEVNGLEYDRINGLYEIPLGAVVTATIKNPAVINVALNGIEQSVSYDEKTVVWTMGSADLVVIKSIEMAGSHSVIRFAGQENEQSFLYKEMWNGLLSDEDLAKLALVFADTDSFYYTYIVGGETKRYDELKDIFFDANSVVTVMKNAISSNAKEIVLHLDGNVSYSIFTSDIITVDQLPSFEKSGYNYMGWSLTENGNKITDEELSEFIASDLDRYELYILWTRESVDYSDKYINPESDSPTFVTGKPTVSPGTGSGGATVVPGQGGNTVIGGSGLGSQVITSVKFVGTWKYFMVEDGYKISCYVTFNSDGTFEYEVMENDAASCIYFGEYRLSNDKIIPLSVEANMNIPIPDVDDFGFKLKENVITANLILPEYDSLVLIECELTKNSNNIIVT